MSEHDQVVATNIESISKDESFRALTQDWLIQAIGHGYAQNFSWMGRPIIQVPQDIYAIQEIIWKVKPDLIIETGIAHGGSLILSASLLALLDYTDAALTGSPLTPNKSKRRVLGIDIEVRAHNQKALDQHPLTHLIEIIEGSSIDCDVVNKVQEFAKGFKRVLLFLDSNHTHDHVLAELEAYAPLISPASYCVVWDSGVEDLPDDFVTNRPWGKGNNPKTAVFEYLKRIRESPIVASDGNRLELKIDKTIEHKISITASPDGFLTRV